MKSACVFLFKRAAQGTSLLGFLFFFCDASFSFSKYRYDADARVKEGYPKGIPVLVRKVFRNTNQRANFQLQEK